MGDQFWFLKKKKVKGSSATTFAQKTNFLDLIHAAA